MSVSANSVIDFQRDKLIRMAFQAAGLLQAGKEPSPDDIALAADFFCAELAQLQAEKVILRTVSRDSLTLVANQAVYTLPADTMTVEAAPNNILGSLVMPNGRETPVFNMTRAAYQLVLDKTTVGTPSRGLVEQTLTGINLTLYPIPDGHFPTFNYARVRLLRTLDSGNASPDLAQRWFMYLVYAGAGHIATAKGMPLDRVGMLIGRAGKMKDALLAQDAELGSVQFSVAYGRRDGRFF